MSDYRFQTWDIFTKDKFAGNPLAIVFDHESKNNLSTDKMQTIAAEFNLSETVFIQTPKDQACHGRLRIFTPEFELPFAGHPTVGASLAIAQSLRNKSLSIEEKLMLELRAGLFAVETHHENNQAYAKFSNPNLPVFIHEALDKDLLAKAVGLRADEIANGDHQPRRCGSGGVDYIYIHGEMDAVQRARLNSSAWEALDLNGAVGIYLYTKGGVHHNTDYHVRMFAPSAGVPEDPATGSAAAGFPAQIAIADQWHKIKGQKRHEWQIEQGFEMGRPSFINMEIDCREGEIDAVSIGGYGVQVSEGVLKLSAED